MKLEYENSKEPEPYKGLFGCEMSICNFNESGHVAQ